MSNTLRIAKSVSLFVAILFGLALHGGRAEAAKKEIAIVAGGCFWCVESDFESVPGVIEVISGFTGGKVRNPTYRLVSRGNTGHYEAVKIIYDPSRISYAKIMKLFFRSIDPTDAGGQFCDRGSTYRTAVFYRSRAQKAAALKARAEAQRVLHRKIVTMILPARKFYAAGRRHQDYYKGTRKVLTRFGVRRQSAAYKAYRKACGRDARVRQLWGAQAPFAGTH